MNDLNKFIILIIISIVLTIVDIFTKYRKCVQTHPKIISELFLHRTISVFAYLGWIFTNKIILIVYLVGLISLGLYWGLNSSKCFLTKYENETCGFDKDTDYDIIFSTKTADIVKWIVQIVIITILAYKLTR